MMSVIKETYAFARLLVPPLCMPLGGGARLQARSASPVAHLRCAALTPVVGHILRAVMGALEDMTSLIAGDIDGDRPAVVTVPAEFLRTAPIQPR